MTKEELCKDLTERGTEYVWGGLKVARMFGVDTSQIKHMRVCARKYYNKTQGTTVCSIRVLDEAGEELVWVKETYGAGSVYKDQAKAILAGKGIEYDIISYLEITVEKRRELWA